MGMFDLGIGSAFKGARSFLDPGRSYEKAGQESEKYYNQAQQHIQPYATWGHGAANPLFGAMEQLLNPSALHNQWMNDYQMSDAAKFAKERAGNEGLWAANAMGMGGSTPALNAIQAGTSRIGAEDQQNYLNQLLQKYLSGANIAQGIYSQGANAAGQLGQNALQQGQNMAQMKYGQEAAPGQMFGQLLGAGANLGGAYMGMQGQKALAGSNNNLANAWSTGGGR
jgi:hypothetical protein